MRTAFPCHRTARYAVDLSRVSRPRAPGAAPGVSASRWKRHERAVAAVLGGVRLPNNGAGQPDVIAGRLAVQVKTRQTVPAWLWGAIDQAERDAAAGQLPAVVLCEATQGRRTRRLFVIDLEHITTRARADGETQTPHRHPPTHHHACAGG